MGCELQARYPLAAITGLALMAGWTTAGVADETFVCADGSTLAVDDGNRSALRQHPCVKAWFAGGDPQHHAGADKAADAPAPSRPPIIYRYTPRRAAGLRDLRRPPALVGSRGRASPLSPGRTADTPVPPRPPTPAPAGKLGVIIKLPQSPGS